MNFGELQDSPTAPQPCCSQINNGNYVDLRGVEYHLPVEVEA